MNEKSISLNAYYRALHDEARSYANIKNCFSILVVLSLTLAIYAKGYYLYAASLSALMLQLVAWFYNYKSVISSSLAQDFQKTSMLYEAYGIVPSEFDLSHSQSRVSLFVSKRVLKIKEEQNIELISSAYNIKNTSSPEHILLSMIQENAFWNHHLFRYSFILLSLNLFVATLFIGSLSLFLIPIIVTDPDYSLPRLGFTVLSFTIIYEIIELALNYRKASVEMLELDNEISRHSQDIGMHEVLRIFSKYNSIQNMNLHILKNIYLKNKDRLNNAWAERVSN